MKLNKNWDAINMLGYKESGIHDWDGLQNFLYMEQDMTILEGISQVFPGLFSEEKVKPSIPLSVLKKMLHAQVKLRVRNSEPICWNYEIQDWVKTCEVFDIPVAKKFDCKEEIPEDIQQIVKTSGKIKGDDVVVWLPELIRYDDKLRGWNSPTYESFICLTFVYRDCKCSPWRIDCRHEKHIRNGIFIDKKYVIEGC